MVSPSNIFACFIAAVALSSSNIKAQAIQQDPVDPNYTAPFTVQYLNKTSKNDHPGLVGYTVTGKLEKFSSIAGDGTFTYEADKNYGGGFNIGTNDIKDPKKAISGIGGGYSFNQTAVNVGAGISAFDQKVNFNLNIDKAGIVTVRFDLNGTSANTLNCKPSNENHVKGMACTTAKGK